MESGYTIVGWTPDSASLYAMRSQRAAKGLQVSRVDIQSGKMEPWRAFGAETGAAGATIGVPHLSNDGTAYAYIYNRVLSEAYVVKGLK